MRALQVAVILMGVLILGATAALIGIVVHRASVSGRAPASATASPAGPLTLDEPAGTRIAAVSAAGDRIIVQLAGGGPDRVVVIGLGRGAVIARLSLAR
jgi:hypothetical protein